MFPSQSQINEIKAYVRKSGIKANPNDNLYVLIFKLLQNLDDQVQKLKKQVKDLEDE